MNNYRSAGFCAFLWLICIFCMPARAATHYVVPTNPGAANPYTSWATAGTSIIDVVNAAKTNAATRVVWVTNGTYFLTNQVEITNALTLQSVNGREVTIVDGNYPNYINRCFYLTNSGVELDGFTITNGFVNGSGGGVLAYAGTTVKNCRITGCIATNAGNVYGGGAYIVGGIITNCEVTGNISSNRFAGGIGINNGAVAANCTVSKNTVYVGPGQRGGGIYASGTNSLITDCRVFENFNSGTLFGGGVCLNSGATVRNSLIYGNTAYRGGGIGMYAESSWGIVQNCTVVSNYASNAGGGIDLSYVLVTKTTRVENTVSYLNTCASGSNFYHTTSAGFSGAYHIVNSCIAPTNAISTNSENLVEGFYSANNIEANPQFAGKDAGNWRLIKGSPCINAGTNQSWMNSAKDFDGRRRIDRFSGQVDMGAYEYLPQGVMISVP